MNPAPLTFLGHLKSVSLTARRRCQKTATSKRQEDWLRKEKNKTKHAWFQEQWVTARCFVQLLWRSGGWKVASRSRRTSNFYRLSGPPPASSSSLDFFNSRIARLEGSDIRSVFCFFFRLCVVEGVLKRHGDGISGFWGWQWRINEKGRFWGVTDSTTTGRLTYNFIDFPHETATLVAFAALNFKQFLVSILQSQPAHVWMRNNQVAKPINKVCYLWG